MNRIAAIRSNPGVMKHPRTLFANFIAASVQAILTITTAISIAALVFSGALAPYLHKGIGIFLIGASVGSILIASISNYRGIIAGPRSAQAPILATIIAGIITLMDGQPVEQIFATSIAAILFCTLLIAMTLFGLGWARMGSLVRYIPYPVMGGFFAGLGFLLIKGGVIVATGTPISFDNAANLIEADIALHYIPAFIFAFVLFAFERRTAHWSLVPLVLFSSLALFYYILQYLGLSVDQARENSWLLSLQMKEASFIPVISLEQLSHVNWTAIIYQANTILVLALMSAIMLLLDISGVEIVIGNDLDPNHELKTAGIANFFTALASGSLVLHAAVDTAFTRNLGGGKFVMVLIYSAIIFAAILIGPWPIAYVPTFILGGLLIYIGAKFIVTWVWKTRQKLPLKDFLVIFVILISVAIFGILEGVGLGIILAIMLFVHSYSQLSVIRSSMTGREHFSNIDRSQSQLKALEKNGRQLQIFILQGFLFFGTASRLLDDIRKLLLNPDRKELKYLILDFNRVVEMDSSAAISFVKLTQICARENVKLLFTGCSMDIRRQMENLKDEDLTVSSFLIFDDLDEGAAWCEDDILKNMGGFEEADNPVKLLAAILGNMKAAQKLSAHFQLVSFDKDEVLFHQGDNGDALYLVLEGAVSIYAEKPDGQKLHIRTMRAGAILGEMSVYTGGKRSASGVTNEATSLFKLDRTSYEKMNRTCPNEASLFHAFVVQLLSDRLGRATKEIVALTR